MAPARELGLLATTETVTRIGMKSEYREKSFSSFSKHTTLQKLWDSFTAFVKFRLVGIRPLNKVFSKMVLTCKQELSVPVKECIVKETIKKDVSHQSFNTNGQ